MKRVMIVGISGAGKSTLARRLGDRIGAPVTHLDFIYHTPGWVARPEAEVQRDFDAIAAQEAWVVDGNFRRMSGALRERANLLIFLDFGRFYSLRHVVQRWALHRLKLRKRIDLKEGFNERLPVSFILWVWNWHANNRMNWLKEFEKYPNKLKVFKTRDEVNAWLGQQG